MLSALLAGSLVSDGCAHAPPARDAMLEQRVAMFRDFV